MEVLNQPYNEIFGVGFPLQRYLKCLVMKAAVPHKRWEFGIPLFFVGYWGYIGYIGVKTHLLTIDPNFLGRPSGK